MGEFRVTVTAVGNHGCQREFGDGETVIGCERPQCTDCITREFVRRLKRAGASVSEAVLLHWPRDVGQVRDDLVTGERRGTFPERERYRRNMLDAQPDAQSTQEVKP
jgi:hypothetical protein